MTRPRVLCVFGTRPELIKMAPVIWGLSKPESPFEVRICATAQHRDLLDPLLTLFRVEPHHDLDLMRPGQTLPGLTGSLFVKLAGVMEADQPTWVLVQGDTTSAMVGAMSGFYARAKVAHIEAGLRTGDLANPFPEEMNRSVIGRLADLHFAPTERARQSLLTEGTPDDRITVTGNTAIDTLQWALGQTPPPDTPASASAESALVLVTLHRRESFGAPLEGMCRALLTVADGSRDRVSFVCPVHPNPNVGPTMRKILGDRPNVRLTPPLDYLTTIHLLARSTLVVTDSGGIQEEAPALGKPVLVLRNTTERQEGVDAGTAVLVGTEPDRIVTTLTRLLTDAASYRAMATATSPYGDGRASARIIAALEQATFGSRRALALDEAR